MFVNDNKIYDLNNYEDKCYYHNIYLQFLVYYYYIQCYFAMDR